VNISNEGGSIVAFRDPWPTRNEAESEPQKIDDPEWLDYCRARELAERGAAKNARSAEARGVHQQLAQAYARMIQRAGH
jgi:hypothetical protein